MLAKCHLDYYTHLFVEYPLLSTEWCLHAPKRCGILQYITSKKVQLHKILKVERVPVKFSPALPSNPSPYQGWPDDEKYHIWEVLYLRKYSLSLHTYS
jgi:hypothetical protein